MSGLAAAMEQAREDDVMNIDRRRALKSGGIFAALLAALGFRAVFALYFA